ncbi:PREDICTED: ectonucleoside triphosphate diphosphohydrolase 6 [Nanorana parkeri]|uniref:ectonucleoside triphosphate diphosphohydrolase 6 n=1 Tax=Nanorana parkeri TaxID=125878 RepID=UPI00085404A4|nr:PREDICTED: ectonucleoside triphosphate diphosphohydrolase 6 [Nanorana parkeri]
MYDFFDTKTMKISKLPCLLLIALCVMLFFSYVTWSPRSHAEIESMDLKLPQEEGSGKRTASQEVFYGIMFDAGSTGTRVHVYKFSRTSSGVPNLDHETFKAIKPGLSAYADEPEKCAVGIKELLDIAMKEIPDDLWSSTPLVLKATAGLRLLPGEKAQKLLDMVRDIFKSSPFLVGKDSVSIMNGTDEGIFAWITVNFLTGSLTNPSAILAGMLDLGGGSTQITFYPYDKSTFPSAPPGFITTFELFNRTYHLYSHSYLGLGLMSARLEIMGGNEGIPLKPGEELVTPCVSPGFATEFEHAGVTYKVKGEEDVTSVYESCYRSVGETLKGKVNLVKEVAVLFFYSFSYYFDRAEDTHLIDPKVGGFVKVKDFETAAKNECTNLGKSGKRPFICMDLCYITHLLQDLGFPKEKRLKLVKQINDVETSWALGATFYYMNLMQGNA